jgi:hypothetical protein
VMEHALRQRAQNADVVVSTPDIMGSRVGAGIGRSTGR